MKQNNLTNIVLGIIAAEVVCRAVSALAEREASVGKTYHPGEQSKVPKAAGLFLLGEALHHACGMLRRFFLVSQEEKTQGSRFTAGEEEQEPNDTVQERGELHLKGSMLGIADKLKDPAWAGVLAANDGNIALADAERAVPMPNSSQFVQRLDRNPFVGKGMKDHSRDKV